MPINFVGGSVNKVTELYATRKYIRNNLLKADRL